MNVWRLVGHLKIPDGAVPLTEINRLWAEPNTLKGCILSKHTTKTMNKCYVSKMSPVYLSTQVDHVGIRVIVGLENTIAGVHLLNCHWLRKILLHKTNTNIFDVSDTIYNTLPLD